MTPSPMATPNVELPAMHSPSQRAERKQLQFTLVFISEASNGFN